MEAEKTDVGKENSSGFYLRYLPFILGFLGLVFVGWGLFLTFSKKDESKIVFETQEEERDNIPGKMLVDVSGAVEKPGVYEIKNEGRYREALAAAGGLSGDADREYVEKYVNLAAKVSDGIKIYIPKVNEQVLGTNSDGIKTINSLININTASLGELDTLAGIGQVTGQKIIDNRPYGKIEELLEKKIVGNSVWEKIKDKISVY